MSRTTTTARSNTNIQLCILHSFSGTTKLPLSRLTLTSTATYLSHVQKRCIFTHVLSIVPPYLPVGSRIWSAVVVVKQPNTHRTSSACPIGLRPLTSPPCFESGFLQKGFASRHWARCAGENSPQEILPRLIIPVFSILVGLFAVITAS